MNQELLPGTSSIGTHNPFRTNGYGWLGLIAAGTFMIYLVFGLYYVTHNAERLRNSGDLRLKNDAYLQGFDNWNTDHEADDSFYNRTAMQVLKTGVPRDRTGVIELHAPLYSYFLAACYAVGGVNRISLAVAQSLVAAALAWSLGLAARRAAPKLGPRVTWLAGGLIMVNLLLAKCAAVVGPTLLLLLWFGLALYVAAGPLKRRGVLGLVALTVLGIFTQAAFFVVATAVALWLAWLFVSQKRIVLALGCGLILFSVGVNYLMGSLAIRAGWVAGIEKTLVLWEANNPYYESMSPFALWGRRPLNRWSSWRPSPQEQQRFDDYLNRGAISGRNPAVLWILENPGQYAKLCWIRLYTVLGPFTGQMSPRNRAISAFYWLLIFPAGFYGLWGMRRLPFARLALLVFAAQTAFEVLVIAEWQLRYRLPWTLILIIGASAAYSRLFFRHAAKPECAGGALNPQS